MNIVRHRPWPTQGNNLQDEIKSAFDRLFDTGDSDESSVVTSNWVPRVDIKEESDRFVIYADLPGLEPEQIEVQMDKGILTIKGERSSESTTQNERFARIERRYGSFHRRFALPDSANPEGIEAKGNNGVLEISIPKKPESAPRRIQVGGKNGGSDNRGNNGDKGDKANQK